jgi:hypothetical protein
MDTNKTQTNRGWTQITADGFIVERCLACEADVRGAATELSLRQRRDRAERPIANRISARLRLSHDCTFATLRLCVRFYSRSFVFPIRVLSRFACVL